ncbi:hypothetical protein BpHYR1_009937 [Brachionus plicatilis]|uniref:Uncharacterized protein n=1 Tax=Brachionus plicatilis TaxID=10195 RepID=A0A3M7RT89_BRAPC|nr:hypothetical protein BpHYR1_009937 [Brachionus plicatilis]
MVSTRTEQLLRFYFKKRLNHNQLIEELNEFESFSQKETKLKRRVVPILHSMRFITSVIILQLRSLCYEQLSFYKFHSTVPNCGAFFSVLMAAT